MEYCCSEQSLIGERTDPTCQVVRITKDCADQTTWEGAQIALSEVKGEIPLLLFAAIPCVGGSTWQFVNLANGNPATREKIMKHRKIFKKIWRNFEQVADQCISNGGDVAIEWPKDCLYWRFREVKRFLARYPGMRRVRFDGCAYGLQSQREATKGMPIKKP